MRPFGGEYGGELLASDMSTLKRVPSDPDSGHVMSGADGSESRQLSAAGSPNPLAGRLRRQQIPLTRDQAVDLGRVDHHGDVGKRTDAELECAARPWSKRDSVFILVFEWAVLSEQPDLPVVNAAFDIFDLVDLYVADAFNAIGPAGADRRDNSFAKHTGAVDHDAGSPKPIVAWIDVAGFSVQPVQAENIQFLMGVVPYFYVPDQTFRRV